MSRNSISAAGPSSESPAGGDEAVDDVAIPDSSDARPTGSDQAAENRKNDPTS
jgi:hypothetical protein